MSLLKGTWEVRADADIMYPLTHTPSSGFCPVLPELIARNNQSLHMKKKKPAGGSLGYGICHCEARGTSNIKQREEA